MTNTLELSRPVALVTGASSGIGAAIAQRLLADGYRVFGTARKPGSPGRAVERTPDGGAAITLVPAPRGVEMVELDVGSDESVERCIAAVLDRAGAIDVLVNNAGYLVAGAVEEVSLADAKAQFETNFFGVARMLRAVLPHMRSRRRGHIITISSLAGLVPVPFWGYYNASKFAVEGLVETLRFEARPFGIKVALVEPGAIKTPFYAQPHAAKIADYTRWRDAALGAMARFEAKAPGPELVATTVVKIARSANPKLRYRITREATMFSFLRWLLPSGAFQAGVRRGFGIDFH